VDPRGEFAILIPVIIDLAVAYIAYVAFHDPLEKLGHAISDWWNGYSTWDVPAYDAAGSKNVCYSKTFDPTKWPKVRKGKQKQPGYLNPEDGSVWEKDNAGHGGRKWKRWKNKRDWERGKRREGSYDENGNRIAD